MDYMNIVEKINYLLQEKGMSKKEFADRLQALEPFLHSTGNIPNIQTIYGYLNGKRELKVELIPYIAEVLMVKEHDLFSFDLEYAVGNNTRYSAEVRYLIELIPYAPRPLIEAFINTLEQIKNTTDKGISSLNKDNQSTPKSNKLTS